MIYRFIIVNTFVSLIAFAAWWSGWLLSAIHADRLHTVIPILTLVAWSQARGLQKKWGSVAWIADKLPIIGLAGTVMGVLLVDISAASFTAARADLLHALVSNLWGLLGYLWLSSLTWVCAPQYSQFGKE